MSQTVEAVLQQAQFYSDEHLYCFVKLPTNAITVAAGIIAEVGEPFTALLVDKDEVSLVIAEEDYTAYQTRLVDHELSVVRYRLITLDVTLEPTLVGLMARISGALAAANISVLPFAAYSRDHLLVSEVDHERALVTLGDLKDTTA